MQIWIDDLVSIVRKAMPNLDDGEVSAAVAGVLYALSPHLRPGSARQRLHMFRRGAIPLTNAESERITKAMASDAENFLKFVREAYRVHREFYGPGRRTGPRAPRPVYMLPLNEAA